MNAMMKLAAKATAMVVAATMFTATVPALAAHAADKDAVEADLSTVTRSMSSVFHYQRIGDVDTTKESYQQPVTIVNHTGKRIERFCIAASEDTCWGDDICGRYYLDNGDELDTSFCVHDGLTSYDFYWVYEDGTTDSCSGFDLSDYPTSGFSVTVKANSVSVSFDMN